MNALFEELAYSSTAIGNLSLRRRKELSLGIDVFEIKLNDDFLMSSLFTEGEVELAKLGLSGLSATSLDVAVGGLGLGYTARTVLESPAVRSVLVIEALTEVIDWHQRGLVPLGRQLTADPRCQFMNGDFFALARSGSLAPLTPGRLFDAILLDIDHSPRNVLHPSHAALYKREGMRGIAAQLRPAGVFALWSNDAPDADFMRVLADVFSGSQAHVVRFRNLARNELAENTVYVARR